MDFYQSSLQEFLSEIFKFPPVFCFRYSYSDFPKVSADIFIEFLSCFLLEIFLGFLSWFFCGDLHGISLRSFPEFLPLTFFIDFSRSSLRDFFRIQTKICPRDFREYCWFLDCSRHLSRISPRMFFLGLFATENVCCDPHDVSFRRSYRISSRDFSRSSSRDFPWSFSLNSSSELLLKCRTEILLRVPPDFPWVLLGVFRAYYQGITPRIPSKISLVYPVWHNVHLA